LEFLSEQKEEDVIRESIFVVLAGKTVEGGAGKWVQEHQESELQGGWGAGEEWLLFVGKLVGMVEMAWKMMERVGDEVTNGVKMLRFLVALAAHATWVKVQSELVQSHGVLLTVHARDRTLNPHEATNAIAAFAETSILTETCCPWLLTIAILQHHHYFEGRPTVNALRGPASGKIMSCAICR